MVLVGYRAAPPWLRGCERLPGVATGVENEEAQYPMFVCEGPRAPWQQVWPQVRRLAA